MTKKIIIILLLLLTFSKCKCGASPIDECEVQAKEYNFTYANYPCEPNTLYECSLCSYDYISVIEDKLYSLFSVCMLATDYTMPIEGEEVKFKAGTCFRYAYKTRSGAIFEEKNHYAAGISAHEQNIYGIQCAGDIEIRVSENTITWCRLAQDYVYGGLTLRAGSDVGFYEVEHTIRTGRLKYDATVAGKSCFVGCEVTFDTAGVPIGCDYCP